MTHITDSRVVGNHADMGEPPPAATRKSLTVTEMGMAQSAWDSEGGAAERTAIDGEGGSASSGTDGLPQTPTRFGR